MMKDTSDTGLTSRLATVGNLKSRQDTIWKKAKTDFEIVSGIHEESKTTVQSFGRSILRNRDVMDARDHVFAGWIPLT